ncbi:MAG: helix-turn-helix transcriptional regulator [Geobacteraceae bacterium]|nr:helix-turn-helix transcriptional regulator [Geobacteraceae bacterium]
MPGIPAEKNLHGYELKCSFDEKVWEFCCLNYGQIFTTLVRFEKDDFVTLFHPWTATPLEAD